MTPAQYGKTSRPSLPAATSTAAFSSAAADGEPVVRTIQSTSCMPERSTVSSMKPEPVGEISVRNASDVVIPCGVSSR